MHAVSLEPESECVNSGFVKESNHPPFDLASLFCLAISEVSVTIPATTKLTPLRLRRHYESIVS